MNVWTWLAVAALGIVLVVQARRQWRYEKARYHDLTARYVHEPSLRRGGRP